MENEQCVYCDTFAIFKELLLADYSMEEAFHIVLRDFEQGLMNESFNDGYIQAMLEVNNVAKTSVEEILSCTCDDDCTSCN